MTDSGRTVVIGAGHNGLVCAAYLARAGRDVLVLEAAHQVGGAAVTRELVRGFRVPAVAHLLHLLNADVVRELGLAGHGFALAKPSVKTIALSERGEPLVLDGNRIESGPVTAADGAAYTDFIDRMRRYATVLGRQHGRVPPRLAWSRWRDALPAGLVALDIRRLGRDDMREFLRVITMPIHDLLEESFEAPALKGVIALDAVLGTKLGPRSGNSVFTYLHRLSGANASAAQPRGGMGGLSEALAAAARAAGAEIRLSAPVASLVVDDGRVKGVRLENGEEVAAARVVSSADPKTTLGKLLGARHLETEFARRLHHLRTIGTAAKLNLALSAPPEFRGVAAAQLGERLVIAPDATYVDEAFNPAKYRDYSRAPVLEITVPSVADPELAPAGKHVLSAIVQFAPYDLAAGWDTERDACRDAVLGVLERYAPGIRRQVVAAEFLSPLDLERQFRITGGHWHHGELTLDQFMMLRPVPGAAQYAMPVAGLFMCGAGCHPGGGVSGAAGRNAARVILDGAPP
jgi:phytoene dehydrogenase-like protein